MRHLTLIPTTQLQLDGFCSALHVLVSPQQLHGLVEMATEIASTGQPHAVILGSLHAC